VVEAHRLRREQGRPAPEALFAEALPNDTSELLAAMIVTVTKLGTSAVQSCEKQLDRTPACTVLLHLRGRALLVVRGVYGKLLTEATL